MKRTSLFLKVGLIVCVFFFAPHATHAASSFEISGWIPYWRAATGTQEALGHLNTFTEINPFGYTVKENGSLYDAMGVDQEPWVSFIQTAKANKVRIIPTVMWGNPDAIDAVLSDKPLRDAHIQEIVEMVKSHSFDGVDIDYEAKYSKTKPYFSLFLKDLYAAMGNKWVECEVEARTPITSRYDNVPADYDPNDVANDYVQMNKYCDRVRVMAYDQGTVDLKLDEANPGLYAPVADPKWVEKVVRLAMTSINKNKIEIGIPTYGYEYIVSPGGVGGFSYVNDGALNPQYALNIKHDFGISTTRSSAGELNLLYYPYASSTPVTGVRTDIQTNLLVWSDAKAIKDKIDLAKKLGVRGVSIFKIDGGMDPETWSILKR
jgi:spore germination protein